MTLDIILNSIEMIFKKPKEYFQICIPYIIYQIIVSYLGIFTIDNLFNFNFPKVIALIIGWLLVADLICKIHRLNILNERTFWEIDIITNLKYIGAFILVIPSITTVYLLYMMIAYTFASIFVYPDLVQAVSYAFFVLIFSILVYFLACYMLLLPLVATRNKFKKIFSKSLKKVRLTLLLQAYFMMIISYGIMFTFGLEYSIGFDTGNIFLDIMSLLANSLLWIFSITLLSQTFSVWDR